MLEMFTFKLNSEVDTSIYSDLQVGAVIGLIPQFGKDIISAFCQITFSSTSVPYALMRRIIAS